MAKKKRKKRRNKARSSLELYKTIRKGWYGFNPITRIVKDKTKYDRNKDKKELAKQVKED